MTIFAVISHQGPELIDQAVVKAYPNQHYALSPSTWFVSDTGTTGEVGAKLGLLKGVLGAQGVVLTVSTYSGWGPADLWEWMKSRAAEAKPNG